MQPLTETLRQRYPHITFTAGRSFSWSPQRKQISYNTTAEDSPALWSLLHETSHALLEHHCYTNDFQLVEMEVAAWEQARLLAQEILKEDIDDNHIQDCLDTYRDWLHKRCICPSCNTKSIQEDKLHYRCFNCLTRWRVTPSRFCRVYRTTIT